METNIGKVRVVKDTKWGGTGYLTVGKTYDVKWDCQDFGTLLDDEGREVFECFGSPQHGYEYEVVTESMKPNYAYKYPGWDSTPFSPPVNNPDFDVRPLVKETDHYTQSEIECVDYLWDNMPFESFVGGLEWNIKKYLHRWRYKENPVKDLRKARDYLNVLIDVSEGKPPKFGEWK